MHLIVSAGEHDVHKDQHFAHMEAATQNLEDNVYMASPHAPLAVRSSGGDHTSAHEEGSQVDNPGHHPLSKLVAEGGDDSVHVRMSHWQPGGRAPVPLLGDAISLPHDGLRRRQLLLEMSELLIVHMSEKIAHHIHTATAQLLVDKEAVEGEDARGYKGDDIHPLHILLLGNNRLQGGEGERHSQLHLEDVRCRCTPMMPPPSHAPLFFLPCFHLPTWWTRMITVMAVVGVGKECHDNTQIDCERWWLVGQCFETYRWWHELGETASLAVYFAQAFEILKIKS